MRAAMPRLFIGIALDDDARRACEALAGRLERAGLRASFIPAANYHLTLLFLGNVEDKRVPDVVAALRGVAREHEPFSLTFDRVGAFPHERAPRVVFAGSRGGGAYRALAGGVRARVGALGLGDDGEKDAVAHVTLARVAEKRRSTLPMLDVTPFSTHVRALTLFESVPSGGRTRYDVRATAPLGNAVSEA